MWNIRLQLVAVLFVAALFPSCQSSKIDIEDVLSLKAEKAIFERKEAVNVEFETEAYALLGESASFFVVSLDKNTPDSIPDNLLRRLESKVSQMKLYKKVVLKGERQLAFEGDPNLNQLMEEYLDTLANVSVSIKDISVNIGNRLGIENMIIIQIDSWPCGECASQSPMRMKLRVVDNEAGLIIWTAFGEILAEDIDSGAELSAVAFRVSDKLVGAFQKTFGKP